MTNEEIGNRIREIREEKLLSRESLAANSGISAKFLYEIETGKKGLSSDTLLCLSHALECSCDYILTGKETSFEKIPELLNIINKFDSKQQKRIVQLLELFHEIVVDS